jgi:hypothetical protein
MIDQNTMAAAARLASAEANYSRAIRQRRDRVIEPAASNTQPAEKTTPAPSIPTNEHLLAEYERSPALRAEFTNFAEFAAFKRAEARGAFRLLRRVA